MPIHITLDRGVDWIASRSISFEQPPVSDDRKAQILPAKKYNLLVTAFNVSTVMLVVAVASTLFFAYSAAVAWGALGLLTRSMTEKELASYSLPVNENQRSNAEWSQIVFNTFGVGRRHHVGGQILERLGVSNQADWHENEVVFIDYVLWKNKAPIPTISNS